MLVLFIIVLIFGNQYILFNEELFIIIAFFCLCYIVKTNLGGLVENELQDRKKKVISSYLLLLTKKSEYISKNVININQKTNYLFNFSFIQEKYLTSFEEFFFLLKTQNLIELNKSLESNFILYFAGLVSKKRKFLINI